MEHGQQPHDSPNSEQCPSILLYSGALVLLEWVGQLRDTKKSFPVDIPARQLQYLNLDEI